MNYHNLSAHINLCVEEEACVTNIQLKVRKEMADNKLVIVGANGNQKQPEVTQNIFINLHFFNFFGSSERREFLMAFAHRTLFKGCYFKLNTANFGIL